MMYSVSGFADTAVLASIAAVTAVPALPDTCFD